jgi:hypothetical protein
MYTLIVRIAEHIVSLQTESSMAASYIEARFGILRTNEDFYGICADLVIEIEDGYGTAFKSYQVDVASEGGFIVYTRADYRLEMDSVYRHAKIQVYDDFALKHALVNVYSSFITHRQWGLLIHSSCMLDESRGYLFAGHSGAGKSTVALLSWPRPVLSDEATIVKVSGGEVVTFASPFRSDSDMPEIPGKFPMTSIQLLRQAPHIERVPVKKMDAVMQLMCRVFYWAHDPQETKKIIRMCKELVDQVPVYDLYFQKNNKFWEEIS